MATIYDVAKKAGVSITTISRVLNNHPHVRESTRRKVMAVLKEMHYIPNTNASSLVRKATNTIAVLVPDITNPFFTTLVRGVEDKASGNGFAVVLGNTDEDAGKEKTYLQMFMERRVDGLIIVPVGVERGNLQPVIRHELPLVLVDREIDGVEADVVSSNNREGARLLVEHLIKIGHRRIAVISGPKELSVYRQRVEGYRTALAEAGLPVEENLILFGSKPCRQTGIDLVKELMKEELRPSAIFAGNNFLAVGAVHALHQAGLEVPKDISVVCFDDNDDSSSPNPFFTTVIQQPYMMGYVAAELLLNRMKNGKKDKPARVLLEPELVIRQSTGKGG